MSDAGPPPSPTPLDGYRPCVGIMLVNEDGLVFVAQRVDFATDAWQMPQGGIDDDEDAAAAALRELEEEIGTAKAEIFAESDGWLSYDLPPELVKKAWKGRYRGQTQKWYACRFTGSNDDIRLDTDHPEFSAWQWVEIERLPELIVGFKRELYARVVADLGPKVRAAFG